MMIEENNCDKTENSETSNVVVNIHVPTAQSMRKNQMQVKPAPVIPVVPSMPIVRRKIK